MNYSFIDFHRISKALSSSSEALRNEHEAQSADLQEAENNFRQALSFGLSNPK